MLTNHLLMIRPVNFGFNAETAVNNAFQEKGEQQHAQAEARAEFDGMVAALQAKGVDVNVIDDTPDPYTPDSIFPNNWISFHDDGTVVLYPMFAPNRRAERKPEVMAKIFRRFDHQKLVDLTHWENENKFLEGTGSMVLDRDHKIAYACLSPRTDADVLKAFCAAMDYTAVAFHSADRHHQLVYHTNVMMCMGDRFVVICLESIADAAERDSVLQSLQQTNKVVIALSLDQMHAFAGNMLQVKAGDGSPLLVMSRQAFRSLTPEQVCQLESFNPVLSAPLNTIEKNGGGSARCMMAEVFLPLKA